MRLSAIPQSIREELKTNKLSCRWSFFFFQIIVLSSILSCPKTTQLCFLFDSVWCLFLSLNCKFLPESLSCCSMINLRFGLKYSGLSLFLMSVLITCPGARALILRFTSLAKTYSPNEPCFHSRVKEDQPDLFLLTHRADLAQTLDSDVQ